MVINETKPKSMSDIVKELPAMIQIRDDVHRWLETNNVKYDYDLSEYDPDDIKGEAPRYFNKSGTFSIPSRLTSQTQLYIKISIIKTGLYVQYEVISHVNGLDLKSVQKVKISEFDSWSNYDYKRMFDNVIRDFKKQSNFKDTDDNRFTNKSDSDDEFGDFLEKTNLTDKSDIDMLIDQIKTEANEHSIDIGKDSDVLKNLKSMITTLYSSDSGQWYNKIISTVKDGDYNHITVELSRFMK